MILPINFLRQTSRTCVIFGNKHYLLSKTNKNIQPSRFSSHDTPPNDFKWHQPSGTDTGIKIYNCVAKKKVPIILKNNFATWYSCGPTVYDSAHIGHASCYVKLDIIQKILINYFNIDLVTCMGITDIDDKIIKRSITTGKSINEITTSYEAEFWKNISDLDITMPDIVTRVTDHIPTIVEFINELMRKQLGYKTSDKSIYFNTIDYENYGKLQNPQDESLNTSNEKKSLNDFVLWKAHKEGEPFWETELGKGRPGWHIECSAMASRLFGGAIDFHAGGIDLKFPHHENEEAQSCAFHGNDQWINYWIHTGHLHLKNDVKMSKSLNNIMSIDDLLKNYGAKTFRMACLMSHYQNYMEFHEETMHIAKTTVMKVKHFLADCNIYVNDVSYRVSNQEEDLLSKLNETKLSIDEALKDDFNTSKCISSIIQLMTETNHVIVSTDSENFKPAAVSKIAKYIVNIMNNFGLHFNRQTSNSEHNVDGIIDEAVKFRQSVRLRAIETKDKNLLTECDNFRSALSTHRININDISKNQKSSWLFNK